MNQIINEWLNIQQPFVRNSTYEGYLIYTSAHIIPYFGDSNIKDIKPIDIQYYIINKMKYGRSDKTGGLSSSSVRKHISILNMIFNYAVLQEYCNNNPVRYCRIPKVKPLSDRFNVLSYNDVSQLLNTIKNSGEPWLYAAVLLTVIYGLRRSEVLGLRWDHVDMKSNIIEISHTCVKNISIEYADKTKTELSKRSYYMNSDVREMLILFGTYNDSEYIISDVTGKPIRPDTLTRSFQRFLKRNNIPRMRYHDLRHTTASILFNQGWSVKEVQNWLGHSDYETTMNIYVRLQNHINLIDKVPSFVIQNQQ